MRLVKMLGLVACLALAAMAFVGATSASALVTHAEIEKCTSGETGCTAAVKGTKFVAKSTNFQLQNSFVDDTCTKATVEGEVLVALAVGTAELDAHIIGATFEGCTFETKALNLPWLLEASADLFHASLTGLILKASVLIKPFGLDCIFTETATDMPKGTWKNGNPSVLSLSGNLVGSPGICGLSSILGSYSVTSVDGVAGRNIVILHSLK